MNNSLNIGIAKYLVQGKAINYGKSYFSKNGYQSTPVDSKYIATGWFSESTNLTYIIRDIILFQVIKKHFKIFFRFMNFIILLYF